MHSVKEYRDMLCKVVEVANEALSNLKSEIKSEYEGTNIYIYIYESRINDLKHLEKVVSKAEKFLREDRKCVIHGMQSG
jgi:hypothetical protein